jgi:purine-cytosine permease-like protein
MIATAGTVTGLLFGFETFLVTNISKEYELLIFAMISLVTAIIINITSVFLSIIVSRIRTYYFVMMHDVFFLEKDVLKKDIEVEENYNEKEIEEYKNMDIKEFQDILIHDYLSCIKDNSETNDSKATKVAWSQRIFLLSLAIIPVLAIMVLHAFFVGAINVPR